MPEQFRIFSGKFMCQKCNEDVHSLRLWLDSGDVTWMCSQKHISKVQLIITRKDYERKI
jgi:hypothetical protein